MYCVVYVYVCVRVHIKRHVGSGVIGIYMPLASLGVNVTASVLLGKFPVS